MHGHFPVLPHRLPDTTQQNVHDVWDCRRHQGYSALHYQQEPFETAAQEHQRVAYEEVETAAVLATSRTAVQMTSRFRDTENNVGANFSQQQKGLLSEITSESAQAPEAERHSLIHEAPAEMMRPDTHQEEVLSS